MCLIKKKNLLLFRLLSHELLCFLLDSSQIAFLAGSLGEKNEVMRNSPIMKTSCGRHGAANVFCL